MIQRLAIFGLSIALAGCGGSIATELKKTLPPGEGTFTASPFDTVALIIPLGNLNPPDHTLPTDHIYVEVADIFHCPCDLHARTIHAPGSGTVEWILPRNPDSKITIRMTSTFSYYIDHVVLAAGIAPGSSIVAGQPLGSTREGGFGLDLGVINETHTNSGFLVPSRYSLETMNADAPLKFFAEPLRSVLYSRVSRIGPERDGRIDYDVRGRLSGNWFLDGLKADQTSSGPEGWPKQLAFVFDTYDPSQARISVGGQLARVGTFGIAAGDPPFASVGTAQGITLYHLLIFGPLGAGPQLTVGVLLVQMQAEDQIRVEMFPGSSGESQFTAAAKVYRR
jgi:hypothetical protein